MGAWGYKALESDGAADAIDEINSVVLKKLRKEIGTSTTRSVFFGRPDLVTQRASVEYLILLHKARLVGSFEIIDLAELGISQLEKVKEKLEDPEMWSPGGVSIEEAQRETRKDINRQIRYLNKVIDEAVSRGKSIIVHKKRPLKKRLSKKRSVKKKR